MGLARSDCVSVIVSFSCTIVSVAFLCVHVYGSQSDLIFFCELSILIRREREN